MRSCVTIRKSSKFRPNKHEKLCCKCREHEWEDPQKSVYTDEDGKGYCVFHAPKEHKGIEVFKFNEIIYSRIRAVDTTSGMLCDLSGTIFPGDIYFYDFAYGNTLPNISFKSAIFSDVAEFFLAKFSGKANFSSAEFGFWANFKSVTFSSDADFSFTNFTGWAGFSSSVFRGSADFERAQFNRGAAFDLSTFSGRADFSSTEFMRISDFKSAKFSGDAYFDSAVFNCKSYFDSAIFYCSARFSSSAFNDDAHFKSVTFNKSAIFNATTFTNAEFNNILAKDKLNFNHIRRIICELRFINIDDLYWFVFLRTDMTNVHFLRSCWPMEDGRYRISAEDEPNNMAEMKDFYQGMKRKYKLEHNEVEVSRWHLAEKEVELLLQAQQKRWSFYRLMLWLYRLSSRFGEDAGRAGLAMVGVVVLPLVVFIPAKLAETGISPIFDAGQVKAVLTDWARCLPLIKVSDFGATPLWKALFTWGSQLLIAIQATLFGFALRNWFRR